MYFFSYVTADGTSKEESAILVKKANGDEALVVKGHYGYIGNDGQKYEVR